MSAPVKFQSLQVDKMYKVNGYYAVKSNYGDSYILNVIDENDENFELWSTKHLSDYVSQLLFNAKKVSFTVRRMRDGKLYPEIEGYTKVKRAFTMLQD